MASTAEGRDANIAAQILSLEATFDNMLQQASTGLRKDLAAREERLVHRMDTERRDHTTSLFELRRDLTMQQTTDLAAHEDRFSRRSDGERRETKAALTELRRDVGTQQEHKVQIANLRRDLGTTQSALSKLATSRGTSYASFDATQPVGAVGSSALEATENLVADLRKELSGQREQIQLQAATADSSLLGLRKELIALQGEEVRSLQEQLSRSASELAKNVQDVSTTVEMSSSTLRGEFRRDMERLRSEFDSERSQAEQRAGYLGMVEARSQATMTRVEEVERKLDSVRSGASDPLMHTRDANIGTGSAVGDADSATLLELRRRVDDNGSCLRKMEDTVMQLQFKSTPRGSAGGEPSAELSRKITSVENDCLANISAVKRMVDDTKNNLGRLTQDLAKENAERTRSFKDIGNRIEGLEAQPTLRLQRGHSGSQLDQDVTANDSVSEMACSRHTGGRAGGGFMEDGSAEQQALAACVGELDAELRVELSERINGVITDLRGEIAAAVGRIEGELQNFRGAEPISRLETRLKSLESCRLDLRVGALESAAQHGAVFMAGRDMNAILDSTVEQLAGQMLDKRIVQDVEDAAEGRRRRRQSEDMQSALGDDRQSVLGSQYDPLQYSPQQAQIHLQDLDVSQPVSQHPDFETYNERSVYNGFEDYGEAGQEHLEMQVERSEHLLSTRLAMARQLVAQEADGQDGSYAAALALDGRVGDYAAALALDGNSVSQPTQPLISDELKDRLEVLVNQVKQTLNKSHTEMPAQDAYATPSQSLSFATPGASVSVPAYRPAIHTVVREIQSPIRIQSPRRSVQTYSSVLDSSQMMHSQAVPSIMHSQQVERLPSASVGYLSGMSGSYSALPSRAPSGVATPMIRTQTREQILARDPVSSIQISQHLQHPGILTEIRVGEAIPVDPARRSMSPTRARSPVRTIRAGRSPSPMRRYPH